MSKLFTFSLLLSFLTVATAQFPQLPQLPGQPKDFQPPRRGSQIPPELQVPSEQEMIRRMREAERRKEIPGSGRTVILELPKDEPATADSIPQKTKPIFFALANELSVQISKNNFERIILDNKTKRLTDGRIDVNVEINVDGVIQSALVIAFPLNAEKRKFAEQAVKMIHTGSPYRIALPTQKTEVELTFYFDDTGKFKVQPKVLDVKSK